MITKASLTCWWQFHFRNRGMHERWLHLTLGGDIAWTQVRGFQKIAALRMTPSEAVTGILVWTFHGDRAFPEHTRWLPLGQRRMPGSQPQGWQRTPPSYEQMSSIWPCASLGHSLWLFPASWENKCGWKTDSFGIKPKRLSSVTQALCLPA